MVGISYFFKESMKFIDLDYSMHLPDSLSTEKFTITSLYRIKLNTITLFKQKMPKSIFLYSNYMFFFFPIVRCL